MKTLKNITIFLLLFNGMIAAFWLVLLTAGFRYSISINEYIDVLKQFYSIIL